MNTRYCRATGKVFHQFDKETHQCKCGRWERGFAPKKEHTKPRAECQVCARQQALDVSGNMVHHGYQRPGFGYIVGDCFGVAHKPYPATDALILWQSALENAIESMTVQIAAIDNGTRGTITANEYDVDGNSIWISGSSRSMRGHSKKREYTREQVIEMFEKKIPRTFYSSVLVQDAQGNYSVDTKASALKWWDEHVQRIKNRIEGERKAYRDQVKWVKERIAKAQELTNA